MTNISIQDFDFENITFDKIINLVQSRNLPIFEIDKEYRFIRFKISESGYWSLYDHNIRSLYVPLSYAEDHGKSGILHLENEFGRQYNIINDLLEQVGKIGTFSGNRFSKNQKFAFWILTYCRVALAIDEMDTQFGPDLSIRIIYGQKSIEWEIYESAQQGDAPEPATIADPASPTSQPPAR